jgi:hypothetical protein
MREAKPVGRSSVGRAPANGSFRPAAAVLMLVYDVTFSKIDVPFSRACTGTASTRSEMGYLFVPG